MLQVVRPGRGRPSSLDPNRDRAGGPSYWWALVPALVVWFAALPVVHGLNLPTIFALPVGLVLVVGWSWVVHAVVTRAAVPHGPRVPRLGVGLCATVLCVAVIVGLLVGVLSVFAAWDRDVEARRADTTGRDAYLAQLTRLTAEKNAQQTVLDTQDPTVDRDVEVLGLRQRYRDVTASVTDAEHAVVCERDGTCGTKVRGAGPNYREKVRFRDDQRRLVGSLPQQIDAAEAVVENKAVELHHEQAAAAGAKAAVQAELDALHPPEVPGRLWAGVVVAEDHLVAAVVRWLVVVGSFLLDLVLAVVAVRWLRRGGGHSTTAKLRSYRQRQAPGGVPARPAS